VLEIQEENKCVCVRVQCNQESIVRWDSSGRSGGGDGGVKMARAGGSGRARN